MNITTGTIKTAQKVVVYGPEGIGKSTFASKFPKPIFIDTEGSTKKLNVSRFDRPTSWTMLMEQVDYVGKNYKSLGVKTLVIDTADWAEKLCINHICSKTKKTGIEDFGYGKGYVYLAEEFGRLLNRLEDIIELGVNVVITAHAQMRKFEQPDEIGNYDRWELKLEKKTAPLLKEWADTLLFANYKTLVTKIDDNKYKAQGGQNRIMYTTHNACYDAKNRDGLPEELPFDYMQIAHLIDDTQPKTTTEKEPEPKQNIIPATPSEKQDKVIDDEVDKIVETETPPKQHVPPMSANDSKKNLPEYIPKALADLMTANDVSEEDIRFVVAQKGYYPEGTSIANYDPEFIEGCLIGAWDKVYRIIMTNKDLPF